MIDVNDEAEKTLSSLDCKVVYYYPEEFNNLPVVSFYNIAESPAFSTDNEEDIQSGTIVVDIWSDNPAECGALGLSLHDIMTADGWSREFSRDIAPEGGIFHRTTRYSKQFIV